MYEILDGLTFDDVLLVPQYSEINSRAEIDISVKIGQLNFSHPIIPANMKSVTGFKMAKAVADGEGLAILHRFMPISEQVELIQVFSLIIKEDTPNYLQHVGVSIGVKKEDYENALVLYKAGARIFCVDVAHGDSKLCIEMIKFLDKEFSDSTIIAGNVATGSGAHRLWEAGADIVKVGVGPGSLCTTRIETGNGVPQLTALMAVQKVQRGLQNLEIVKYPYPDEKNKRKTFPFIADGGLRSAGEMVKALCFADMVMSGNLFAGCEEAPGAPLNIQGMLCKEYVGSSTHKANHIEGVSAFVPQTGEYRKVLTKLLEGIRSGCSYQGANSLAELKDSPTFIKITSVGLKESHPHSIIQ